MSLINGDPERRNKFFKILTRFGPLVSLIGYLSGIAFLVAQPHSSLVHRTYMSENALSPGLVSSDIFSTDILLYYNDLLKNQFQSERYKFYLKKKKSLFMFKFIKRIFKALKKLLPNLFMICF